MLTRIITAIVAIAAFVAVLLIGEKAFLIGLGIVILCMTYESTHIMTRSPIVKAVAYIDAVLIFLGMTVFAAPGFFVFLAVGLLMLITVLLHGKSDHKEIFAVGLMTLYISLSLSHAMLTMTKYGNVCMLLIFISAWSSDTGAYFAGSFLGKHKLIPHVSPKKTVEGSIGGLIAAMLCCQLLIFIVQRIGIETPLFNGFTGYLLVGGIGIVASAISQIGDLVASAVKRDCGVKDYGKLFPGHGGMMDRFDSVILVAPFVYYILGIIARVI